MEKIYRVLGKRGRVTIPYEIRQKVGFSQNDVLSFERSEDGRTVTVRRERICDCAKSEPGGAKNEVTLYDFLNSLTPKQQRAALGGIAMKIKVFQIVSEMSFTVVEPRVQKFEHNFDEVSGFEKALVNGEEKRLNYGTLKLFEDGTYEVGIVVGGKTYTFTVTVDATAPTLKIDGVENGGKTTGGVVLSEPSETAEVKVYRGEEEIEYKLGETISEEGEYRVTVTDECGNSTVYTFTIEAGTNWALIILLVVLGLLIAGGVVFFFIRRKRVADQDEA